MLKFKIVLAGAKGVGKSSLIARYIDGIFMEKMMDTIGVAFKRKKIELEENLTIDVTIWDFAGEEEYRNLLPSYLKGAVAALILYDTTIQNTLEDIHNWVELVDMYAEEDVIKVLIGTKIDLIEEREITKEEAEKYCAEYDWSVNIIETSSKTGENVEEAFSNVVREIISIKLQKCEACREYFNKKLKICNYCGQKVVLEAINP